MKAYVKRSEDNIVIDKKEVWERDKREETSKDKNVVMITKIVQDNKDRR